MIPVTDKQLYIRWSILQYFLMFGAPLVAAGIIWGVLKEPSNNTAGGRFALGAFIIGFLAIIFLKDFVMAQIEQIKLDKKVSFIKNRMFEFLIIGIVLFIARAIADDAITFCIVGVISHTLAKGAELFAKKYYRKWKQS